MNKRTALNLGSTLETSVKEEEFYTTTVRNIPVSLRDRFNKLKAAGKVSGSLSAFMIASAIEKISEVK